MSTGTALLLLLSIACAFGVVYLSLRPGDPAAEAMRLALAAADQKQRTAAPRVPKSCATNRCGQGRKPCPTPADCGVFQRPTAKVIEFKHRGIERHELDLMRLQASAAADEAAQRRPMAEPNPHPKGSSRWVVWESFYLEALLADAPPPISTTAAKAAPLERQS